MHWRPSMRDGSSWRERRFPGMRNGSAALPVYFRALPAWPAVAISMPGQSQSQAIRRRRAEHERRCPDLPGDRQRFTLSDPSGQSARCPRLGIRGGLGSWPAPLADAGGRRSPIGPRSASLRRRRDPGRGASGPGLIGDTLSVRVRVDQHAGAIRRADGSNCRASIAGLSAVPAEPVNPGFEPDTASRTSIPIRRLRSSSRLSKRDGSRPPCQPP